jgi:hypothetical protein
MFADAEVHEARTRVFQAALTQAEELWEAASAVGAASRPLPLFYCLSQAGRAIAAAWTQTGPWEPTSHGLTSSGQDDNGAVASFAVRRTASATGAYSMVAAATDSTVFEGSTTVAALWAALPDIPRATELTGNALQPLHLAPVRVAGDAGDALYFFAPRAARVNYPRPPELPIELAVDGTEEAEAERLRAVLPNYPALANAVVEVAVGTVVATEREVILRVPDGEGGFAPLHQFADRLPSSGAALPSSSTYVVRPRQGDGTGTPPSQLMTLWALVYALSQLARYHPATWVEALNPDRSPIAVDLEHALDAMLELVPDLLVPAVSNGMMPRLIRERMAAERDRERLQAEVDAEAPEPPAPAAG